MVNIRRQRTTRRRENTESNRYQPFAQPPRPPQHPNTQKVLKKSHYDDSRDDAPASRRPISRREQDDNGGYSSDGSVNTLSGRPYRNNDPVTVVTVSLKQGLKLQKIKLGDDHPSVTKAIHSLALEYKMQGKLSKSVRLLKEGIQLLDERLTKLLDENAENDCGDDDSRSSAETRDTIANSSQTRKIEAIQILEEKSVLLSCLGNVYRARRLYREALDYYVKSCEMLVEAGYSGESKRVSMMIRIMRRTEEERVKKVPLRRNVPKIQKVNLEALMC